MTNSSTDNLFRQVAEAEDGICVSAGARLAHVRLALESGRAVTIDLSEVPEGLRTSLVAVIREMVSLAAGRLPKGDPKAGVGSSIPARSS